MTSTTQCNGTRVNGRPCTQRVTAPRVNCGQCIDPRASISGAIASPAPMQATTATTSTAAATALAVLDRDPVAFTLVCAERGRYDAPSPEERAQVSAAVGSWFDHLGDDDVAVWVDEYGDEYARSQTGVQEVWVGKRFDYGQWVEVTSDRITMTLEGGTVLTMEKRTLSGLYCQACDKRASKCECLQGPMLCVAEGCVNNRGDLCDNGRCDSCGENFATEVDTWGSEWLHLCNACMDEDQAERDDDGFSDVEADADTLRSAGWGTDEDYGFHGGDDY